MKSTKMSILFTVGILALLLAAGCSQAVIDLQADADLAAGPGLHAGLDESFTVTFTIGGDDEARSVAGPDANRIYVNGANGIRNFVQLIVLDQESQTVVGIANERKKNKTDDIFQLSIGNLARSKPLSFLLLMGNWMRLDDGPIYDNYYATEKPTLLAAGITNQALEPTGQTTVSITMWPMVVDTRFKNTTTMQIVEPKVVNGVPQPAYLTPGDWNVEWTIQRSIAGTNGFEKALLPAQVKAGKGGSTALVIASKASYTEDYIELEMTEDPTLNVISSAIPNTKTKNGDSGNVYFNLKYMPFGLTSSKDWMPWSPPTDYWPLTNWTPSNYDYSCGGPVWIIRNGLSDFAQDGSTNFNDNIGYLNADGNGAVKYVVGLDPTLPENTAVLELSNGSFVGSLENPKIKFDAKVTYGTADLWYAVVSPGTTPNADAYTSYLGEVSTGNNLQRTITAASGSFPNGFDVHVRLAQSSKGIKSAPIVIKARPLGDADVNWDWGDETISLTISDTDLSSALPAPAAGGPMPTTVSGGSYQYTGGTITWAPADANFVAGTQYTATVTLTATSGFTFENVGSFFHYAGTVQHVVDASRNSVVIEINFPALAPPSSEPIYLYQFIGRPVPNNSPVAYVPSLNWEGEECSVRVIWLYADDSADADYDTGYSTVKIGEVYNDEDHYYALISLWKEGKALFTNASVTDVYYPYGTIEANTSNEDKEFHILVSFPTPLDY
jgi:hypothetical protein